MQNIPLVDYYSRRAAEYERIYQKPERQEALEAMGARLQSILANQRVLELACGTGYWTKIIANSAHSVHAIDASEAVLEIAQAKSMAPEKVTFALGDAWRPPTMESGFTACLAAFFLSHIEKQRLPEFVSAVHTALGSGASVVFIDNRFVPESSTPLSRVDAQGNTYQLRHLDNGATFEVLKNFPTSEELTALVRPYSDAVSVEESKYFWCLSYTLR